MRKPSMMGASKYEFEPDKFEEDIKIHLEEYREKKDSIGDILQNLILSDEKHQENFNLIIENLRYLKEQYDFY